MKVSHTGIPQESSALCAGLRTRVLASKTTAALYNSSDPFRLDLSFLWLGWFSGFWVLTFPNFKLKNVAILPALKSQRNGSNLFFRHLERHVRERVTLFQRVCQSVWSLEKNWWAIPPKKVNDPAATSFHWRFFLEFLTFSLGGFGCKTLDLIWDSLRPLWRKKRFYILLREIKLP